MGSTSAAEGNLENQLMPGICVVASKRFTSRVAGFWLLFIERMLRRLLFTSVALTPIKRKLGKLDEKAKSAKQKQSNKQ